MTEENKKSLMKKTKSELVEIIARKDETEQKYAADIKALEANIAELSDELSLKLNLIKSYEEGNSEFSKDCEEAKNKVKDLQLQYITLEEKFNNMRKQYDHQLQTFKSNINVLQEDKEDLQVKASEYESKYYDTYNESRKYKSLVGILAVVSAALLGVAMLAIF